MKQFVVIGGNSGIGKELVEQLLNENNAVVSITKSGVDFSHPNLVAIAADVLSTDLSAIAWPEIIDGLVYCPGSINLKPFNRIKPEDFVAEFELNVVGAVKTIQACLPNLKKSSSASIVLFSTVAANLGMPFHSSIASAKGAVEGLAKSLAAEFAPIIRVNVIAPSLTDTPLAEKLLSTDEKRKAGADRHPLKKVGTPADQAAMAAFLLSEKAGFITGQIIGIDGGMSAVKI